MRSCSLDNAEFRAIAFLRKRFAQLCALFEHRDGFDQLFDRRLHGVAVTFVLGDLFIEALQLRTNFLDLADELRAFKGDVLRAGAGGRDEIARGICVHFQLWSRSDVELYIIQSSCMSRSAWLRMCADLIRYRWFPNRIKTVPIGVHETRIWN